MVLFRMLPEEEFTVKPHGEAPAHRLLTALLFRRSAGQARPVRYRGRIWMKGAERAGRTAVAVIKNTSLCRGWTGFGPFLL